MAKSGAGGSMETVSLAPAGEQVVTPRAAGRGLTRRQALGAALATGLGVGAIRLIGGSMQQIATNRSAAAGGWISPLSNRSEEHTSELQSHVNLVCRLLLEKKNK